LSEYTEAARRFVWNELADWYLESTKSRIAAGGDDGAIARAVLAHRFDAALRLLQPIVPFITDTLWRRLPVASDGRGDFISVAPWPVKNYNFAAEPEFELVREAINSIRQLRADYSLPPGDRIHAHLDTSSSASGKGDTSVFDDEREFIARLTRCDIDPGSTNAGEAGATILLSTGSRIIVPLAGVIDLDKECRKTKTELEKLRTQLSALEGRLANPGFTDRAPANVVEAERQKLTEWTARRGQLTQKVVSLCGS
jgi:valyl-tRNA synthetase